MRERIWLFGQSFLLTLMLLLPMIWTVQFLAGQRRDQRELLAAADLVIARSGALTLAELEAMGRASVLIPSPNVAENHQYYNALELQQAGAALVFEEKDLSGQKLIEAVQGLLAQPGKLAAMGQNAKTLGNPHSLDIITQKLLELVQK